MYGTPVGSQVFTAGTTLVPVGYEGRIFNVNILTGGTGGTGLVTFYTGGSGVTAWLDSLGTVTNRNTDYGVNGVFFPNGIYMTPDSGVTRVLVSYRKESQT